MTHIDENIGNILETLRTDWKTITYLISPEEDRK
jgi:hypothetical protein